MKFEARACPICGKSDRLVLFREANLDPDLLTDAAFSSRKLPEYMHARLDKCQRCSLVFANPAPASESLQELYRDASFEASTESQYAAKTYVGYLRKSKGLTPAPTIDIGAGDGAFLAELVRHGYTNVIGFEPSGSTRRTSRTDSSRPTAARVFRRSGLSRRSNRSHHVFPNDRTRREPAQAHE